MQFAKSVLFILIIVLGFRIYTFTLSWAASKLYFIILNTKARQYVTLQRNEWESKYDTLAIFY